MSWRPAVNDVLAAVNYGTTSTGIAKTLERIPSTGLASVEQLDATSTVRPSHDVLVSTDPPYYDNISHYGARQISRCNTALTVCLGVAGIMAV